MMARGIAARNRLFATARQAASLRVETGSRRWPSAPQQRRLSAAAVALTDVSIAFRLAGGGTYAAVERASLHVADGEFVAIVGPTGCGKSTLLNVAAGLIAPSPGRVEIFGAPLAGAQPAGRLSVSGRRAVSLEDRAGECRDRAGDRRHAAERSARRARKSG